MKSPCKENGRTIEGNGKWKKHERKRKENERKMKGNEGKRKNMKGNERKWKENGRKWQENEREMKAKWNTAGNFPFPRGTKSDNPSDSKAIIPKIAKSNPGRAMTQILPALRKGRWAFRTGWISAPEQKNHDFEVILKEMSKGIWRPPESKTYYCRLKQT